MIMMKSIQNFLKDESGLETVEYALLAAAILAVVVVGADALAAAVDAAFDSAAAQL